MDTLVSPPPSRLAAVLGGLTALAVLLGPLAVFIWSIA